VHFHEHSVHHDDPRIEIHMAVSDIRGPVRARIVVETRGECVPDALCPLAPGPLCDMTYSYDRHDPFM